MKEEIKWGISSSVLAHEIFSPIPKTQLILSIPITFKICLRFGFYHGDEAKTFIPNPDAMRNLKTLLPALLLFFGLSACGNAQQVPQAVQEAFHKKFPNASQVEWGKENPAEYEAEFVQHGTRMSANFTADGSWKETETVIDRADLPEAVLATLSSDFADADVREAARIENAEGTLYEVEVGSSASMEEENEGYEEEEGDSTDLIFDASGKLIKKVSGSSEEED